VWIQLLICSLVHVFGKREYYSNIKGEHIDAETLLRHAGVVAKGGGIVYDSELGDTKVEEVPTLDDTAKDRLTSLLEKNQKAITVQRILEYASDNGANLYRIPYFQLLEEFSTKIKDYSRSKLSRMVNVMSLSVSLALLDFEFEALKVLSNSFSDLSQRLLK
jgi:2-oxoglutarate/2-oxoacid ferredoxin oxidoreductase subunit alpha